MGQEIKGLQESEKEYIQATCNTNFDTTDPITAKARKDILFTYQHYMEECHEKVPKRKYWYLPSIIKYIWKVMS